MPFLLTPPSGKRKDAGRKSHALENGASGGVCSGCDRISCFRATRASTFKDGNSFVLVGSDSAGMRGAKAAKFAESETRTPKINENNPIIQKG